MLKPLLLCAVMGVLASTSSAGPAKHSRHRRAPKTKLASKNSPKVDKVALTNCLRELRRLRSVAMVGTTYSDYCTRVVDAQVALDESAARLPSSPLKTEILAAMAEFVEARRTWGIDVNTPVSSPEMEAVKRDLLRQTGDNPQHHWTLAYGHLARAEQLAAH